MSESSTGSPALRQLLWIAAGVAALTLLVVAASWLFSPRPAGSDAGEGNLPAPIKEDHVQRQTFVPETPSAGPTRPSPSVAPPTTTTTIEPPPALATDSPTSSEWRGEAPPLSPPGESPGARKSSAPSPSKGEALAPKADAGPSPSAGVGRFGVQVGAFGEESKAREMASRLEANHYKATIMKREGKFKVLATGFPDRASAEKAQSALAKAGIKSPFIVPLE